MSLIKQLKSDQLESRKQHNTLKTSILTTLLGELQTEAKSKQCEVYDEMVFAKVKKFISNNKECQDAVVDEQAREALTLENDILSGYLPTQMTALEIRAIIEDSGAKNIGEAMKFLQNNFNGKYDGRMAAVVVREVLA